MDIEFTTREYEFEHGHKPVGTGTGGLASRVWSSKQKEP